MRQENQRQRATSVESLYRTQFIIWLAILFSVCMFFFVTMMIEVPADRSDDPLLVWILLAVGVSTIILSFVLRRRFREQAIEKQNPGLLQTGLIIGLSLCELAGMFGMFVFFVNGTPLYYLFFILSALGILLHMPRQDHIRAATFREGGQGFTMR
jgi:O-antigen/teichoic acid export membrane protein